MLYYALTSMEAFQWVWNHTDMVLPLSDRCLIMPNFRKKLMLLFTACNVKWLGLRGDDLQLIPQSAYQELKPRDLQIAKSLLSSKFLQVSLLTLNFWTM